MPEHILDASSVLLASRSIGTHVSVVAEIAWFLKQIDFNLLDVILFVLLLVQMSVLLVLHVLMLDFGTKRIILQLRFIVSAITHDGLELGWSAACPL